MSTTRRLVRYLTIGVVTTSALLGAAGSGLAVPPPPSNPSDSDIRNGHDAATAKASEVGVLTDKLAAAEDQLQQLSDQVELKMEDANKAQVDLQAAQQAAVQAQRDADAARADADAAAQSVAAARKRLDDFATRSYQQGSAVGSLSAFIGAKNPQDLLDRAQLLDAVGRDQLNGLEWLQRAQTTQANKDSIARAALQAARAKRAAADAAKQNADTARDQAVAAQQSQAGENQRLTTAKDSVEQQLYAAQAAVSGLQNQRQRYQDWLAAKQREEAAVAAAAAARPHVGGQIPASSGVRGSVQVVIDRALGQLGMPYAWGGGNAGGPTLGIRDGGVADSFGDYRKVGFDCSGLMIYAYGVAGVPLPHYSGYQYTAGRHVPLSQIQPGDLLFWGGNGGIHHVAMYLGGGRMIEAPYSGSQVRVVSVRYGGGIMPYATRLL